MTNYYVSITKNLVKGVKLMTDRYKKVLTEKVKVAKKIHIFSCTTMITKHLT